MTIGIIDYHICNMASVCNSLKHVGADARAISRPEQLASCSHLVLPGVGTFSQGMHNLKNRGLDEAILASVGKGIPLLGICLGMQLLARVGEEVEETPGLGLVDGEIRKLAPDPPSLRLPHMGWNTVRRISTSSLWKGIDEENSFYFVHTYGYNDPRAAFVAGLCEYGGGVVAAIEKENVFGVQFHPEKSQKDGLQLLRNFVAIC